MSTVVLWGVRVGLLTVFAASFLTVARPTFAVVPSTERVSVSSSEEQANHISAWLGNYPDMAISGNGRYVVFVSRASNLAPGDTNGVADVFRRDRLSGETIRVSLSSRERQGNRASSFGVDVSANGNLIVFGSRASNLVRRDTNGAADIFLRSVSKGTTTRLSVDSRERQGDRASVHPAISDNGRRVVFASRARLVSFDTRVADVYVRKHAAGRTLRVSQSSRGEPADLESYAPAISGDGKVVAFTSRATNLVAGRERNFDEPDVFTHVLETRRTARASVDSRERPLGGCSFGGSSHPALNRNGRRVIFTHAGPGCLSVVMLRNRRAGTTRRVDLDMNGRAANGDSSAGDITAKGRYVLFGSYASDLVPADTNGFPGDFTGGDVFLRDLRTKTTARLSLSASDAQADDSSLVGRIAADGAYAVFASKAENLVAMDTNSRTDVFLRGRLTAPP